MGSPPSRIRSFVGTLERLGVNVTVRDTRGRSIEAACGQLALAVITSRAPIPGGRLVAGSSTHALRGRMRPS
jgi:hypothetical protein